MTTPATVAGVRKGELNREKIIERLRRYAELYGDDFTAAAFSPSSAKWGDRMDLVDRYHAGDPETGEPWPSLNAIKRPFGGSFNAAREAAGLPPNKPGPSKRRKAGTAAPIRGVAHPARQVVRQVVVGDKEAIRALEKERDAAIRRAERAEVKLAKRPEPKIITKTKVKTVTKRVGDGRELAAMERARDRLARALEKAEVRIEGLAAEVIRDREALKEARAAATKAAARLERAEATINTLRAAERDVIDERDREVGRLTAELERAKSAPREKVVIREEAPEVAVVREAEHRAEDAERRAVKAERQYRELAAAVTGEERRLSPAEMDELRSKGPAGPAVLGSALTELAKARRTNSPTGLKAALTKVASAAVSWKERL